MKEDVYHSLASAAKGTFKDRGSRFLAFAFPVQNKDEVRRHVKDLKKEHHSARHHCYAFRLGTKDPLFRASDDGEPSGTAGKPIYGQIITRDLTNILIVVIRYFGGTKLGTAGLINAYRTAAGDCLDHAKIIDLILKKEFEIQFAYDKINSVMRIIDEEQLTICEKDFTDNCKMKLLVRQTACEQVMERMTKIPGIQLIT